MVRCSCGLEAVIRTSWTNRNPSRRFYGCPTLSPTCVDFLWCFDPPMCQRKATEVLGYGIVDECGFELIDGMNSFVC
ncbi:zinc finger, GRF-type containing protein [Tanacetum coccineum]